MMFDEDYFRYQQKIKRCLEAATKHLTDAMQVTGPPPGKTERELMELCWNAILQAKEPAAQAVAICRGNELEAMDEG